MDRLLRCSNSVGFFLFSVGIICLLALSQHALNYETYISENALLIGVVDEAFTADRDSFQIFKEFQATADSKIETASIIRREMKKAGLEFYEQSFSFSHTLLEGNHNITGSNSYAIMRSRSGSRTEAIVVIAPLRATGESETLIPASYTYLVSIAKQLKRQLYWAKDVIFLFPDMENIGLIAWLDAYHGVQTSSIIHGAKLGGRSGSLQAGVSIEYPDLKISRIDVSFQGINGELPNLDLVNTVTRLAKKSTIPLSFHGRLQIFGHSNVLLQLKQLIRSIWLQASGSPSGLHGPLINFQVPCLTLRGIPSYSSREPSGSDLQSIGSHIEGLLRCLNNLQERFHQSFFYYLLPDLWHYISIGVYSPPFFVALSGLLIQVILTYSNLCQLQTAETCGKSKKENEIIQRSESSPKEKDLTATPVPYVDSLTTVRRRKRSQSPNHPTCKGASASAVFADISSPEPTRFPTAAVVPAAASLILSLAAGVVVHAFPDTLYVYLVTTTAASDPGLMWPLAEQYCFFVFVCLTVGFAVLLPVSGVVTKSRWFGFGQDWELTKAISLLLWCGFLGCLSPLNFSASFLLLVVMEPVLLTLCLLRTRLQRVFGRLLLLCVSPPALIVLAATANRYVQLDAPSQLVELAPTEPAIGVWGRLILQAHMEAAIMGSWTWGLLSAITLPLWLFTWNGLLLADCTG